MIPGLLYFVCAAACFVSIVLLIPIPETRGRDLRDLIENTTNPIPETKGRDLRDLIENTTNPIPETKGRDLRDLIENTTIPIPENKDGI